MLTYADIKPKLCITFEEKDINLLVEADQGRLQELSATRLLN